MITGHKHRYSYCFIVYCTRECARDRADQTLDKSLTFGSYREVTRINEEASDKEA